MIAEQVNYSLLRHNLTHVIVTIDLVTEMTKLLPS